MPALKYSGIRRLSVSFMASVRTSVAGIEYCK